MKNKSEVQKWKPFFKLFAKIRIPWFLIILSIVFKFASTFLQLKLPMISQALMQPSDVFPKEKLLTFIGLTALSFVFVTVFTLANAVAESKVVNNIREILWSKLIRVPMKFYNKEGSTEYISRVTQDAVNSGMPFTSIATILDCIYAIIGAIGTMYLLNKQLTFMLLPLIPWIIFISIVQGKFEFKGNSKLLKKFSEMTSFITEKLINIKLIKACSTEEEELERGNKVIDAQCKATIKLGIINALRMPGFSSVEIVIKVLILIIGAKYVLARGLMKIPDIIAFYMYSEMLIPKFSQIFLAYINLKVAHGSTAKICEIIEGDSEILDKGKSFTLPDSDIIIKDVTFGYNEREILKNVNLTIPKGKVTAIIGASGSGKTTLFSLLEKLYEPKAGAILFGDVNINDIKTDEWRRAFGYVSQNSPILTGTIRENISYGLNRKVEEAELIRVAKLANAYDFIMKCPKGFDSEVGELGSKLSGGERQRIAIARSLIKDPEYLLLDEATCSLDACAEKVVQDALDNLMKDRTVIVIAHNMKTIMNADQIVVIKDGVVDQIGNSTELYKSNSIFKRFVDLQAMPCSN